MSYFAFVKIEIAALPSQIIVSPSPQIRRQQPRTPTVNYVYPISSTPSDHIIEPLHEFYSPSQRHNHTDRSNPWNRYNSQRYSDDEQERNVVYPRTILR